MTEADDRLGDLAEHLADPARVFLEAWTSGIEEAPVVAPSEFANRVRILPDTSPIPGAYRWERTPYVREIMDNQEPDSGVWLTAVQKGTQVGITTVGECFVAYVIGQTPGVCLFVEPNRDMASEWSKTRIEPMIAASPLLAELVSDGEANPRRGAETITLKRYPGGYLAMIGANSASGFRARSARFGFYDEVDGWPHNVGKEGDPLALAFKRTDGFKHNRKILVASTPTVKGTSRIAKLFEETDQRYYHVPCPVCGAFQPITYAAIVEYDERTESAAWQCKDCRRISSEAQKGAMLAAGYWHPTTEARRPGVRGYHLSALYSPWKTWGACVAEHRKAKRAGAEELQTWVNTVLAEVWEDPGADPIDQDELAARPEPYRATVPEGVLILTAGVDVQVDRVEIEVVGWGRNEESWAIEYAVIYGDTAARRRSGVWPDLDEFLGRRWAAADGTAFRLAAVCIDSGFRTQQVYAFTAGKSARRVFAVKGSAELGLPVISGKPYRKRSGRRQRHVDLFIVGTQQASGIVHSRLTKPDGFGVCHWPNDGRGFDLDYFRQLSSMTSTIRYVRGVGVREWHVRKGQRNEAFDCRVYAYAALGLIPVDFDRLAIRLAASRAERAEQLPDEAARLEPEAPGRLAPPPPRPAPARRSGSTWKPPRRRRW